MQQVYNKLPLLFLAIIITSTSLAGCKKKDMSLKLNEPRNIKGSNQLQTNLRRLE